MTKIQQLMDELNVWKSTLHPFNFRLPRFDALERTKLQIELEWASNHKIRTIDRFALWDRMHAQGRNVVLEEDEVHVALHLLWVDLDDRHRALRGNRPLMQTVYQKANATLGEKGLRLALIYFFEIYPFDRGERKQEIRLLKKSFEKMRLWRDFRQKGYFALHPVRIARRLGNTIDQENWSRILDYAIIRSQSLVAETGLFAGNLWLRFFKQNLDQMMQHVVLYNKENVEQTTRWDLAVQKSMDQLRAFIRLAYDENAKGYWPKLTRYWVESLFQVYLQHDYYLPTDYEVTQLRVILDMYVGEHWQKNYPEVAELMEHWRQGRQISSLFRFMNAVAPYVVRCVSFEAKEKVNRHWQRRRAFWMRYWRQRRVHLNRVFIPKNLWDSYSGVIREKLQRFHLNGMYKLYTERYYRIAFHFTLDGRYDLTEMMFNGKFRIYHNRFHQIYNASSFSDFKLNCEAQETHHTGQWERTFDDLIQRVTHRPAP